VAEQTKLTVEQRIHNAEGAQQAEFLHAKHSYLHAMIHCKEEWDEIWSQSDDISWAHAFGRMRGFEEVWFNSVATYNWRGIANYGLSFLAVPEISRLTDFRSLSETAMHTLATDIIEVAEDGQTARGFFLTPGILFCAPNANGHYWADSLWERYGSDFRFEDGEWRYLHEQVCPDVGGSFDITNVGATQYEYVKHPEKRRPSPSAPPPKQEQPAPEEMAAPVIPLTEDGQPNIKALLRLTDPGPLHFDYSVFQTVQNTVPWPEPYRTMDNDNTYTKDAY
jgi:hypothetical protein